MVFYFSGTGNSRHVARRIADAINDTAIPIARCMQEETFNFQLSENERLGLVSPVYFWGLPQIVIDFMSELVIPNANHHYTYAVATFGTSSGGFRHMSQRIFCEKGWQLNASFSIRMVDVWTPLFDVSDENRCRTITLQSEPKIDAAIQKIQKKTCGNFDRKSLPWWIARWQYALYVRQRQALKFRTNSRCVGCGICAKLCPMNAIYMKGNRPIWNTRCTLCLSCLHHCPSFAIEYGKSSHKHGQFLHPSEKGPNI